MIKWFIFCSLFICGWATGATIESINSPTSVNVVIEDQVLTVGVKGSSLSFCREKSDFKMWSKTNLIGKSVVLSNGELVVSLGSDLVNLEELLARNGFVYSETYKTAVVSAAAERRGDWACATKDAVFMLVLKDERAASLIGALALNESKYNGYPWPWTLNVQGVSMYFSTRMDAYREIQKNLRNGIVSFDIGLLQISWKFHSNRFASAWDALEPSTNIRVSYEIVSELQSQYRDLKKTIRCYHNCKDELRGAVYLESFNKNFDELVKAKRRENG